MSLWERQFIAQWEKQRRRGRAGYLLKNGLIALVTFYVVIILIEGYDRDWVGFPALLVSGFIWKKMACFVPVIAVIDYLMWRWNEGQYRKLIGQESQEQ